MEKVHLLPQPCGILTSQVEWGILTELGAVDESVPVCLAANLHMW